MKIAVGCPVRDRGWILPTWFDHVEAAFEFIDQEPTYVFAVSSRDEDSEKVFAGRDAEIHSVYTNEEPANMQVRSWTLDRITEMAVARNKLLGLVRELKPDFFLSVDSDILLHPKVLANLIETAEEFDAVGGKCYMTPMGQQFPSYAMVRASGLLRDDSVGVFKVEAIMALKLMSPAAYAIDYRYDHKGEDIGWSVDARKAGVTLGWDGRITNKHVMLRRQLHEIDPRAGF